MSKADNRAKTKWNAKNYIQVKIHADPRIAAAFKEACRKSGLSMAAVLSQFMAQYSALPRTAPAIMDDISTRGKRRKLVQSMAQRLVKVRDAEERYLSNIPENLQGSSPYDAAEQSISIMDEVIELLDEVY
jgi:hypothetical protein